MALLRLFAEHEIAVHVDGGWGVDTLLGEQTRPHADLDIAMQHADVPRLRALLAERGYREIPVMTRGPVNSYLADAAGHEVDVHSYEFDADGEVIFGVPYPAASLTGRAESAICLSPVLPRCGWSSFIGDTNSTGMTIETSPRSAARF